MRIRLRAIYCEPRKILFRRGVFLSGVFFLVIWASSALAPAAAYSQQLGRSKLPVLNKIESNGPTKGAFTGIVQNLDSRGKVLEVSTADGSASAIFPISKKVKISSIEGRKLKLAALTPGTNVIVNYEQQGARRTVQEITVVVKAPASSPANKSTHPSS